MSESETNPKNIEDEKEEQVTKQQSQQKIEQQNNKQTEQQPLEEELKKSQEKKSKKNKKQSQEANITPEELKLIKKKLLKYDKLKSESDNLKKQYSNLRQQYENLMSQKDQYLEDNKELIKKVSDQQTEIKPLFAQNQALKSHLKQKTDQCKRIEKAKLNIEGKLKEFEKIIDLSAMTHEQLKKSQDKAKRQQQKQREFLKIQKDANNNLKQQVEKLRVISNDCFYFKQEMAKLALENKSLKQSRQQFPLIEEKYGQQEKVLALLKEKLKESQQGFIKVKEIKEKLEKKLTIIMEQKKLLEKQHHKLKCQYEEKIGENQVLKNEVDEERQEFDVAKKKYVQKINELKRELHNQHEKLKITQYQLSQNLKMQKKPVQMEGINVMSLSKEDLMNHIQQLEMKNQSLKINLDSVADTLSSKDQRINEQQKSIVTLTRELLKDYPDLEQSQGMHYVEKDIIAIGKQHKSDWGLIIEKVMIENLRLKFSVTALGEEYNQQIRKKMQNK